MGIAKLLLSYGADPNEVIENGMSVTQIVEAMLTVDPQRKQALLDAFKQYHVPGGVTNDIDVKPARQSNES